MLLLVVFSSAATYVVTKRFNGPADFFRAARGFFSGRGRGLTRVSQQQMGYSDLAEPINAA